MANEVKSESAKKNEDWMNSKWRPMMGWTYMLTCISDFVIFPVLWSIAQAMGNGQVNIQWQPITLQGAGLFHIAMGAILGIAVYGRTKEKLEGANNGGISLPSNVGTTYVPPAPVGQQSGGNFGAPVATTVTQTYGQPQSMGGGFGGGGSFGGNNSFSRDFDNQSNQVTTGFRGKASPPPAYEPEI